MKMYAMFKKTYDQALREVQNKECVRCGATIRVAEGFHECNQCVGLNNQQLLAVRLQRMQARDSRTEIGKFVFFTSTLVASFLLYSALA